MESHAKIKSCITNPVYTAAGAKTPSNGVTPHKEAAATTS
jgi:hypothetical protein